MERTTERHPILAIVRTKRAVQKSASRRHSVLIGEGADCGVLFVGKDGYGSIASASVGPWTSQRRDGRERKREQRVVVLDTA